MNRTDFPVRSPVRAPAPGRTLVIGDLFAPLAAERCRRLDRMLARVHGASLDAALAAGCPPESSRLLAARAQDIVALPRRTVLAGHWGHLLQVAGRSRAPAPRSRAVPVRAAAIRAADAAIDELIRRLTAPLPVAAQGVATARLLLTDPTSPVYNGRSPRSLADLLEAAIAQLDPARPLLPALSG